MKGSKKVKKSRQSAPRSAQTVRTVPALQGQDTDWLKYLKETLSKSKKAIAKDPHYRISPDAAEITKEAELTAITQAKRPSRLFTGITRKHPTKLARTVSAGVLAPKPLPERAPTVEIVTIPHTPLKTSIVPTPVVETMPVTPAPISAPESLVTSRIPSPRPTTPKPTSESEPKTKSAKRREKKKAKQLLFKGIEASLQSPVEQLAQASAKLADIKMEQHREESRELTEKERMQNLGNKYGVYDTSVLDAYKSVKPKDTLDAVVEGDDDLLLAYIYSTNPVTKIKTGKKGWETGNKLAEKFKNFKDFKSEVDKMRQGKPMWGGGNKPDWYFGLGIPTSKKILKQHLFNDLTKQGMIDFSIYGYNRAVFGPNIKPENLKELVELPPLPKKKLSKTSPPKERKKKSPPPELLPMPALADVVKEFNDKMWHITNETQLRKEFPEYESAIDDFKKEGMTYEEIKKQLKEQITAEIHLNYNRELKRREKKKEKFLL